MNVSARCVNQLLIIVNLFWIYRHALSPQSTESFRSWLPLLYSPSRLKVRIFKLSKKTMSVSFFLQSRAQSALPQTFLRELSVFFSVCCSFGWSAISVSTSWRFNHFNFILYYYYILLHFSCVWSNCPSWTISTILYHSLSFSIIVYHSIILYHSMIEILYFAVFSSTLCIAWYSFSFYVLILFSHTSSLTRENGLARWRSQCVCKIFMVSLVKVRR